MMGTTTGNLHSQTTNFLGGGLKQVNTVPSLHKLGGGDCDFEPDEIVFYGL